MAAVRTVGEQVYALFALEDGLLQDPYPLYARLREEAPVHFLDGATVLVSRHAEAKSVYRNHELFLASPHRGGSLENRYSLLDAEEITMMEEIQALESLFMAHKDGEDHRRVRGAGQRAFTPKRVADLTEAIQRITDELLDDVAAMAQPDLIQLAYRLPLLVIMEMMGAPRSDADRIKTWGDELILTNAANPIPPQSARRAHRGLMEYRDYVRELARRHREGEHSSLLVEALVDASGEDRISDDELAAMYVLLLFAGHETTANLIGNGIYALFKHPDQWELLRDDLSLAASATEELLRYDSPTQFFGKVAAQDLELASVAVPRGTAIMIANGAANRDPEAFSEPDRVDITRRPNDHLALGHGIHFCLGGPVARAEGRIAFETLARRFPELEPAIDPSEMVYRQHRSLRGLTSIPVRLGPDHGRA